MATVAPPGLAPDESQATYDTLLEGRPAIIKYFRLENSRARSELLSTLEAAERLEHPNLIRILQSGETDVGGEIAVYAIMEKADDNLAAVLRGRTLDPEEMRELLDGVLPALEFLHAKGFVHSRIRPANILASGNTVKISSDRIRSLSLPRSVVEPPGLYDAPETGAGRFSPASDVYSVAVLILEALTGAPLESGIDQLPSPWREIVLGGLERNPEKRWTLHRIRKTLHPEAARSTPFASAPPYEEDGARPRFRKLGVMAISGTVVAGAACALLVRSAHQPPQPPATPAPVVRAAARASVPGLPPPPNPAPAAPLVETAPAGISGNTAQPHWFVVGAAYRRQADAEKRVQSIEKTHPRLRADVYPATPNARRYLVVFGQASSEAEARKQLRKARAEGAPREAYITRLE